MHFLAGTIIALAVIWFMRVSRGFRHFVFVVAGLACAGVIAMIYYSNLENEKWVAAQAARERAVQEYERRSLSLIKESELSFLKLDLKRVYSGSWQITGTVQNLSKYALRSMKFLLVMQDCAAACIVVGQEYTDVAVTVPPNQARGFAAEITFANLPEKSRPQWFYSLAEIKGIPSDEPNTASR